MAKAKTQLLSYAALTNSLSGERYHVIYFGGDSHVVALTHHSEKPMRKKTLELAKQMKATAVYICDDKLEHMDVYEPSPTTAGAWCCIQKPYSKEKQS